MKKILSIVLILFGAMVDVRAEDIDIYLEKANAALSGRDQYNALRFYGHALKAQPRSREAMLGMARSYSLLPNWDKVEFYANKILAQDESDTEALALLGRAHSQRSQWGEAKQVYQRLIKLDPENNRYYLSLSGAHRRLGEYAEADEMDEKYRERLPE